LATRHVDTLICLKWYVLVLTLRLAINTLFGKQDEICAKIFCIPKNMHPIKILFWARYSL